MYVTGKLIQKGQKSAKTKFSRPNGFKKAKFKLYLALRKRSNAITAIDRCHHTIGIIIIIWIFLTWIPIIRNLSTLHWCLSLIYYTDEFRSDNEKYTISDERHWYLVNKVSAHFTGNMLLHFISWSEFFKNNTLISFARWRRCTAIGNLSCAAANPTK